MDELDKALLKVQVGEFIPLDVEINTPFVKPSDEFEFIVMGSWVSAADGSPIFPEPEKRLFKKCPLETPEGAVMVWKRIR